MNMPRIMPVADDQLGELFALYNEYDRPADAHPEPADARSLLARIRNQGGEIFVAVEDGILGTYMIHICQNLTRSGRPYATIENVICSARQRRSGVGRALMEHAIEHARKHNCYKLMLQTGEHRSENHAFYTACGFTGGKRAFQLRLP